MNRLIYFLFFFAFGILACQSETSSNANTSVRDDKSTQKIEDVHDWAKNASIYEVNIRQHTPEGSIKAFLPHLTKIKDLGVDILWIMPIHPIGEKNRKGGMGSYYAVKDYKAVNPEFGTMAEFKMLVDSAHAMGFKVLLDWVANHTAWDHVWTQDHPDYYSKDSLGHSPIVPPGTDWTDVADLDYENGDMRNEMIDALEFWVKEADIDGYRCDVAHEVPLDFWVDAVAALNEIKPVFMLAESDKPIMHKAFHMTYAWDYLHTMGDIAKGNNPKEELDSFLKREERYDPKDYRMFFTTNHDENSWNKNIFDRYGDYVWPLTVMTFTIKGMPLIYSGQEAGLDKDLRFFEKDTIDWSNDKYRDFYKMLLRLHQETPALWNGSFGVLPNFLNTSDEEVIAYERMLDGEGVVVYVNLGNDKQEMKVERENIDVYLHSTSSLYEEGKLTLEPFGYTIFKTK